MKIYVLFCSIILLMFWGCSTNETVKNENDSKSSNEVLPNEVDQLMLDIDANLKNMPMAQSMLYTKEDNTMTDAKVYFDKNNVVAKIEDYFLDGKTSKITRTYFYFNGGTKFASRKIQQKVNSDNKEYFSEKVTFYDKKGKETSTKERIADFEELLENESYQKAAISKMDESYALQKINQQDEFKPTFQGFVETETYTYLIVGENNPNGYTSSLSIHTPVAAIAYLKNKGKSELGRELVIDFERAIDSQGYEMQILIDAKIVGEPK